MLPRYRCHKEVQALKIQEIQPLRVPTFTRATCRGSFALGTACGHCERCDWERAAGGGLRYTIVPAEAGFPPFQVSFEYVRKHGPKPGGYYVLYEDGYESYSPAKAFEEGYAKI